MESVSCNICGSEEAVPVRTAYVRHYGRENAFRLVRCAKCGLVYLNPRPDKKEIGEYYPPQYQADMLRLLRDAETSPVVRIGLEMVRRRRAPPQAAKGRLLDIGCSRGTYLAGLRQRGWEVVGIEIERQAAEYARTQFELPVKTGDAADLLPEFPDEHFDVVTMWHVVEHFYDPARVLAEIRRILKPGGLLMLELPNFSCPLATIFGEYWFPLEIPRHLYHFTPRTLEGLLGKAGLRLASLKGVPSPEAISWSLRALRRRQSDLDDDPLSFSPILTGLLFPISWLMARLRLSDHMRAVAAKPAESEGERIQRSGASETSCSAGKACWKGR